MAETLFKDPPHIKGGEIDQITQDFLDIARETFPIYEEHFSEIEELWEDKDKAADTDDPTVTNRRTNSTVAHKALQKTVKQMERPSFKMFASEASENVRATMQGLAEDVLRHAGWDRVLTDKKVGANYKMIGSGNAIIGYAPNPFGKFPLQYYQELPNRYFANPDANIMRSPGHENEVRRRVIVKEYQWEQAVLAYPELAGNAALGALPCWSDSGDFKFKELQETLVDRRRIQIMFCRDIDYMADDGKRGLACIIAGSNAFKFRQLEGKDYKDLDKYDDPILPEGILTCFPRINGLWDYGFLQLLKKLGDIHSKLMNMGITYTLINANPVRVVATNMSQTEVAGQLSRAMRDSKEGKIPMMVAADGKEFGGVSNTAAPPIINEANAILAMIEKDIGQLGVNLNDIVTDRTKTLGALQLEVAAATDLVKYIQDTNAPEYQFLIENGLRLIANRKADDSKISLVSSVKIRKDDGSEENVLGVPEKDELGQVVRDKKGKPKIFRSFNLEDFKEMMNKYDWKIIVSGGVVNNPVLEDAIDRNTQLQFPGTRAARKAAASMHQRHGRNYSEDDFSNQISGAQVESSEKF